MKCTTLKMAVVAEQTLDCVLSAPCLCAVVLASWHVETVLQMCRASHTDHSCVPSNQGTNDAEPASNTKQNAIILCQLSYGQKEVRYEKQAKDSKKQAIRSHRSD